MDKKAFTPYPLFETERLKIRELRMTDANDIYVLRSDEKVQKYLDRPKAKSVEDASKFIARIINIIAEQKSFYWGITLKNDTKVIGTICLWNFSPDGNSAEVGYEIHPDLQGQGMMREALLKILNFGFSTVKLESITAVVHPENERSVKILEKNGFKYSGAKNYIHIYMLNKRQFV